MKRIIEYTLPCVSGEAVLEMPEGARLLTVQNEEESPTLYAEACLGRKTEHRTFDIFESSQEIPHIERARRDYLGTVVLVRTRTAWSTALHIYERKYL